MIRKRNSERGATLVEFTFLVPVLMTIAIGMFEMGLTWSDKVNAAQAVRLSTRTITHLGNGDLDGDGTAEVQVDQQGILALRASMFDQWEDIEFVVVYKATATGDMEAPICLERSDSAANCNHYDAIALAEIDDDAAGYWDHNNSVVQWDWESRNNDLGSADHVGVYVQFAHDWETGFFPGSGVTISESAVMRMEPASG